jgi:hypothetical protein
MAQWRRQMNTPYAYLSEGEKESDREQARPMIVLIREHLIGVLERRVNREIQ